MTTTTEAMEALDECLALVSEATPGEWEVLGDYQGHPCGLEWTIESPSVADEEQSGWIAGHHGGDGIATTGNPGCEADAKAIAASVNFIRTHGATLQRALALLAAVESGEWKCVPVDPCSEMIDAGIMFGNSPNKACIIFQSMLAAAPAAPGVEG